MAFACSSFGPALISARSCSNIFALIDILWKTALIPARTFHSKAWPPFIGLPFLNADPGERSEGQGRAQPVHLALDAGPRRKPSNVEAGRRGAFSTSVANQPLCRPDCRSKCARDAMNRELVMGEKVFPLILDCVSFQHNVSSWGPGARMDALCRMSARQATQFAFHGQSTRWWVIEVALHKNVVPGHKAKASLCFARGQGALAKGLGPKDALRIDLTIEADKWQSVWDMAARGIVPNEIEVLFGEGTYKAVGANHYFEWSPSGIYGSTPIFEHRIAYWQPRHAAPVALADEFVARVSAEA